MSGGLIFPIAGIPAAWRCRTQGCRCLALRRMLGLGRDRDLPKMEIGRLHDDCVFLLCDFLLLVVFESRYDYTR